MIAIVRVEWTKDSGGRWKMEEVPGSEKFFPAQLVFLALGFLGPQSEVINALGVKQDGRSNIQTAQKVCMITTDSSRVDTPLSSTRQMSRAFLRPGTVAVDSPLSFGGSSKWFRAALIADTQDEYL